jgi:hypothetical protein
VIFLQTLELFEGFYLLNVYRRINVTRLLKKIYLWFGLWTLVLALSRMFFGLDGILIEAKVVVIL